MKVTIAMTTTKMTNQNYIRVHGEIKRKSNYGNF